MKRELDSAQHGFKEKDKLCTKLEGDIDEMQKKMAVSRDDYEQQLEILKQKCK